MFRYLWGFVLSLTMMGLTGCGGGAKNPGTVPATVMVKQKGVAVSEAIVTLTASDGKAASGITKSDGVAKMTTSDGFLGAMPGEYSVSVVKMKVTSQPAAPTKDDPERTSITTTEQLLPKKYGSPATSNLKVTFSKESPSATIDLTD